MVSHYLTIKLIGREHIPGRKTFHNHPMREVVVSGINHRFRWLSQSQGQITHVLLTRSPLEYHRSGLSARLACVKHAASVRPEPGSNSPSKNKPHNQPKGQPREKESHIHGIQRSLTKTCQKLLLSTKETTTTDKAHGDGA
jgi:hypothetical protein